MSVTAPDADKITAMKHSEVGERNGMGYLSAMRVIIGKDWIAVRRSKSVFLPMIILPSILLVIVPLVIGFAARAHAVPDPSGFVSRLPHHIAHALLKLPPRQQFVIVIYSYFLMPLFLIVPLMVASVLASDAFAGEKERKTLEGLLHLPIKDEELFYAKVVTAFLIAVVLSWVGFVVYAIVVNTISWPIMHRIFLPTRYWLVTIFWVGPAIAAFGLGVMVRISARVQTTQEANQLGGAVVLPLVFAAIAQTSGLAFMTLSLSIYLGFGMWILAIALLMRGAKRFTRDQLAARM